MRRLVRNGFPLVVSALLLAGGASARRRGPAYGVVRTGSRLTPEVVPTLRRLHELDRPYAVAVTPRESAGPGRLFPPLDPAALHPSYHRTVEFCREFDPRNRSDAEVSDASILAYLRDVVDMAPIREAMRVTRRRKVEDLAAVWFRRGRGFEHIVCGETGTRDDDKLGGYHFWYVFAAHEAAGEARYLGADYGRDGNPAGMADPRIVTGKFTWDPGGPGAGPVMSKRPRGGFLVGHSVATLLAAGHLAYYGALRNPVEMDMNGKVYPWTFYRNWRDGASSIRTLWPRFVK